MRPNQNSLVLTALALTLMGGTLVAGTAQADRLVLDPATTKLSFVLGATGHDVEGTLKLASGEVTFDPAGGPASGSIAIDARSAQTGSSSRDKTMHADVLETEKYPQFVFTPRRLLGEIAPTGTSKATLEGELAIHGRVESMILPATIVVDGDKVHATTSFVIPFVAWGMKDPSVLFLRVEKEVQVNLEARGSWVRDTP